uniref:Uncharacterized protein n=1 Tax=Anguilla anguilla TaxID=7936 RepID=A0A0E9VEA9_ANGAN
MSNRYPSKRMGFQSLIVPISVHFLVNIKPFHSHCSENTIF